MKGIQKKYENRYKRKQTLEEVVSLSFCIDTTQRKRISVETYSMQFYAAIIRKSCSQRIVRNSSAKLKRLNFAAIKGAIARRNYFERETGSRYKVRSTKVLQLEKNIRCFSRSRSNESYLLVLCRTVQRRNVEKLIQFHRLQRFHLSSFFFFITIVSKNWQWNTLGDRFHEDWHIVICMYIF